MTRGWKAAWWWRMGLVGIVTSGLLGTQASRAAVITPVGVLATSEFGAVDVFGDGNFSDVFAVDLIDGGGLIDVNNTPDNILDDLHDNDFSSTNGWHAGDFPAGLPGGVDGDGDWLTAPEVAKQIVEFDLGGMYAVDAAHIWQQNQGMFFFPPPPAEARGVDEFAWLVSTSTAGDDFSLVGRFQLVPETGAEQVPAQIVALADGPVTARRIRFQMVSATSGETFEFVGLSEVRFTGQAIGLPGDFDLDGALTVADINLLNGAIRTGTANNDFDLNGDGTLSAADRDIWVEDLKHTWYGDANLDGQFDTADFVQVFQAGEYEDGVVGNSRWETGDWNGDSEFDSGDFVIAFQGGGFEQGPRAAVASVPEPTSGALALLALTLSTCLRRRSPLRSIR